MHPTIAIAVRTLGINTVKPSALLANTDNARNNKVFGSPSFIVNNEIFWGDDRMEDAINWSKK